MAKLRVVLAEELIGKYSNDFRELALRGYSSRKIVQEVLPEDYVKRFSLDTLRGAVSYSLNPDHFDILNLDEHNTWLQEGRKGSHKLEDTLRASRAGVEAKGNVIWLPEEDEMVLTCFDNGLLTSKGADNVGIANYLNTNYHKKEVRDRNSVRKRIYKAGLKDLYFSVLEETKN